MKNLLLFYYSKNKISEFQGFSGKADGSDKAWFNIGQRYGIPIKNYRPYHLHKDNIRECETAVSIANRPLKRDIDKMRERLFLDCRRGVYKLVFEDKNERSDKVFYRCAPDITTFLRSSNLAS